MLRVIMSRSATFFAGYYFINCFIIFIKPIKNTKIFNIIKHSIYYGG